MLASSSQKATACNIFVTEQQNDNYLILYLRVMRYLENGYSSIRGLFWSVDYQTRQHFFSATKNNFDCYVAPLYLVESHQIFFNLLLDRLSFLLSQEIDYVIRQFEIIRKCHIRSYMIRFLPYVNILRRIW